MTDTRIDLADVVNELTESSSHNETYEHDKAGTAAHITIRPSLIAQLRVAMTASATTEEGGRPGFGSKPSARLDAIDALIRIDQGAVRWLHRLTSKPVEPGHTMRHHGDPRPAPRVDVDCPTEGIVRRLHSTAVGNDQVERDIRAWWLHARIVTGWDTPAFRPNNTCPTCGKRGGLRVRVDREANTVVTFGLCVECKSQWTGEDGSFDQLAWHIRVENHDTVGVGS